MKNPLYVAKSKRLLSAVVAAVGFDKARAIESASCAGTAVGADNNEMASPYRILFIIKTPSRGRRRWSSGLSSEANRGLPC